MEKEFYNELYDKFQQFDWNENLGFIPCETETKKTILKVLDFLLREYSTCNPKGSYEEQRVNFLLKVKKYAE